MSNSKYSTPILFLIFNRPDTTQRVFDAIRQVEPQQLFIAADGPRNIDENKLCEQARSIVNQIDWPCHVETRFQETNLGCKEAVGSAINWFFEHVEQGIILEDDCLPDISFFRYCQELLDYYKEEDRVMVISGNNFQKGIQRGEGSYYFSAYYHCWGWATWKRAWNLYDKDMNRWPEIKRARLLFEYFTPKEAKLKTITYDKVYNREIDTWDYAWYLSCLTNKGLGILPNINLVENIGFGHAATHTHSKPLGYDLSSQSIVFPLNHPEKVERNLQADEFTFKHFSSRGLIADVRRKIMNIFSKIKIKKRWNRVIDSYTQPVGFDHIAYSRKKRISVSRNEVVDWLKKGGLEEFCQNKLHKKGLEFFFSFYLLEVNNKHSLLDAAGGRSNYLKAVRSNVGVKELYLTDHIYEGIKKLDDGIHVVGGDISAIHIKDSSLDRIACHHAFEHFQEQKDVLFIREAHRILKENGAAVIIPLFLTEDYVECWNITTKKQFDKGSTLIIDKTASIPGADDDGHFARFYSNESLIQRIIDPAEKLGFHCEIIECEIDEQSIPDMKNNFGSSINVPMRALKLKKVKNG